MGIHHFCRQRPLAKPRSRRKINPALDHGSGTGYVPTYTSWRILMKNIFPLFLLAACLLAAPAMAGPWTTLEPVSLSASSTSASLPVGEKLGKIDNLRFGVDGATVQFESLTLIPIKGEPIALRTPVQLKSGESSGLINVPGPAVAIDTLKLEYRIIQGGPATLTLRAKLD